MPSALQRVHWTRAPAERRRSARSQSASPLNHTVMTSTFYCTSFDCSRWRWYGGKRDHVAKNKGRRLVQRAGSFHRTVSLGGANGEGIGALSSCAAVLRRGRRGNNIRRGQAVRAGVGKQPAARRGRVPTKCRKPSSQNNNCVRYVILEACLLVYRYKNGTLCSRSGRLFTTARCLS